MARNVSRKMVRWMILVLVLALMVGCAKATPTAVPAAPTAAPPTEAPAPTAVPEAPEAAAEDVLLVNDVEVTKSEIMALELLEIQAEDKGEMKDYEGYSMLSVLELAGAEGETLTMTADDGYTAAVAIADLTPECMVRIRTKGGFSVTLPGLPSDTWIKGVVKWETTGEPVATEPEGEPATEADPDSDAEAVAEPILVVNGVELTLADITALEEIEIEVEHKDELVTYQGYRITDVLALAEAEGATLTMLASDGYAADVDIAKLNPECIVRLRSDGGLSATLPGHDTGAWVKGVIEFTVSGDATASSSEPVAPEADAVVTVADKAFSQADLESLGVVTIEAESKGEMKEYTGVSLNAVLDAAGVSCETITLVADDGYAVDVALAEVTDECLLSFRSQGGLSSVMPGLSGATWVKGVVEIKGQTAGGVTVVDALDREVMFGALPSRIVVPGKGAWMVGHPLFLFPEAQERVLSMEARRGTVSNFLDCIVAGFVDLPHLDMDAAPEQIAPLKPDCVIMKSYMADKLGTPLETLGLNLVYVDLETPEQFYDDMGTLGQLFDNEARAEEIVAYYASRVERIESTVATLSQNKPRVLVIQYNDKAEEVGFTVPPMGWMQTMETQIAGGEPVWADAASGSGFTNVNLEQIAAWNPDVIFVIVFRSDPAPVMAQLKADPTWQELSAVQNDKLYAYPMDHYGWDVPDPRWILGVNWVASKLYPTAFADLDIMAEVYDFYGQMYGLTEAEIDECIVPYLAGDIQ